MEIVVHFPLAHHNAPSRAKHAMPLATRSFVRALLMSENETAPTGRAFPGRAFSLAELAARWAPMRKIDIVVMSLLYADGHMVVVSGAQRCHINSMLLYLRESAPARSSHLMTRERSITSL